MLWNLLNRTSIRNLNLISPSLWDFALVRLSFVHNYYSRNELIWNDGFLFDFLQKKTADIWVRRFVIYTGFLFSERLVFDSVVRLYVDNVVWLSHNLNLFESNNAAEMLNITLFVITTVFLITFGIIPLVLLI